MLANSPFICIRSLSLVLRRILILQFLFKLCSTPHNEVAESKASAVHASNFDGNFILTVLKRIGWFLVLNNLEDNVVSKALFSSSESQ